MSAHCSKHGCDLVYPPGTWPLGECRECVLDAEVEQLRDAIRDILDISVGWSRNFAHAEMLIAITKLGNEALSRQPPRAATSGERGNT